MSGGDGERNSWTEDDVVEAIIRFGREHSIEGCALLKLHDGSYELCSDYEAICEPTDLAGVLAQIRAWDAILTSERTNGRPVVQVHVSSPTNPIARGGRPPDPAVERRRQTLIDLVDSLKPATVRQVFYAASIRGLVEKSEEGYRKVQNDLTLLRKGERLPYGWLADSTRWQRKPRTFSSIQQALEDTAKLYRKRLWENTDEYVEVWLEKDALAGVIFPITGKSRCPADGRARLRQPQLPSFVGGVFSRAR